MKVINQHELKRTINMQTKFKDIAQYYLCQLTRNRVY